MSNIIYWDPSTDADIASYLVEYAASPAGPWSTVASVVHAIPSANYLAGPPPQFFCTHAAGTLSTWYRLTATDGAGQSSDPSTPFQVGTSSAGLTTTELEVCQMALANIGVTTALASLTAPTSKEERLCALFYYRTRDRLLRQLQPQWAIRRTGLALDTGATRPGWSYVYRLPPDLVRVLDIEGAGYRGGMPTTLQTPGIAANAELLALETGLVSYGTPRIPYSIESNNLATGRVLCCDVEDAVLVYVASVSDPSLWDPEFLDAVTWVLAAQLVMPLAVKPDMAKLARDTANGLMLSARAGDLNESRPSAPPDSEFITGRAW